MRIAAVLLCCLLAGTVSGAAGAEKVLKWPSGTKTVGEKMFYGDTSLQTVYLPEGVDEICSQAFAYSSVQEIHLPKTIRSMDQIAGDAFEGCENLRRIYVPEEGEVYDWAHENGYLVEFRALVIGENTFPNDSTLRNAMDANRMAAMLNRVSGYTGDPFAVTKIRSDENGSVQTAEGIRSAIQTAFAGTESQDVSLFFIATHGYRRGLRLPDGDLSFETLAGWLAAVPGRVIVILQSCYAGDAIYSPEAEENGAGGSGVQASGIPKAGPTEQAEEESFVKTAVQVFARKDPGAAVIQQADDPSEGVWAKSGELRVENKFYVLAASRHDEENFGTEGSAGASGNMFTNWLLQGIGQKANSPADVSPKNGELTLQELYNYVNKYSAVYTDEGIRYQHVQCYPNNCAFVCFVLK